MHLNLTVLAAWSVSFREWVFFLTCYIISSVFSSVPTTYSIAWHACVRYTWMFRQYPECCWDPGRIYLCALTAHLAASCRMSILVNNSQCLGLIVWQLNTSSLLDVLHSCSLLSSTKYTANRYSVFARILSVSHWPCVIWAAPLVVSLFHLFLQI